MYFSIKHFPEIANRKNLARIERLTKPYFTTPSYIYLLHIITSCVLIKLNISAQNQPYFLAISLFVFIAYLALIYVVGINTWKRRQFLAHSNKIIKQSEQSDIELSQPSLLTSWQGQKIIKTYVLNAPSFNPLNAYEFGYLSLSEKGEQAITRVLDTNDLPAGHIKIAILNEQIIPAVINEQSQVLLIITEQPINAQIVEIETTKNTTKHAHQFMINVEEQLLIVKFDPFPNCLNHHSVVTVANVNLKYHLRLVAIDEQGYVAYKVTQSDTNRALLHQDRITFIQDKPLQATVLGYLPIVDTFNLKHQFQAPEIQ